MPKDIHWSVAAEGHRRIPHRRGVLAALLLPVIVWMAIFYVMPLALMLWTGTHQEGTASFSGVLGSQVYLGVLWTTLWISVATTVVSLALGYPVAYALTMTSGARRVLILLMVSVPYWLDYTVRSYSWMVLLGRHGIVNAGLLALGFIDQPIQLLYNFFSVSVAMVQVQLPIMILTLFGAMLRIDRTLMAAAAIHGGSGFQAFRTVFLPLSLPGVYAASLLVFISALGFYVIPALLGGPHQTMISQSIVMLSNTLLRWGDACAMGVVLLLISVALTVFYDTVFSAERLWGGSSDDWN